MYLNAKPRQIPLLVMQRMNSNRKTGCHVLDSHVEWDYL